MGTQNPQEANIRGARALAQTYGRMLGQVTPPGKLVYSGTAASLAGLPVGRYYVYADGGDVAISDSGVAVADGTCPVLQGPGAVTIWLGPATGTFTLSAIGKGGATGNLWISPCDDVG